MTWTGHAHHAVYLPSPERWLAYPAWAHHRRDEIIARIKSELREPDYEYSPSGGIPTAVATTLSTATATAGSRPRHRRGPLLAVAILLAWQTGSAWLALPLLALPWALRLVRDFTRVSDGPAQNALLVRAVMLEVGFGMLLCAGALLRWWM